MGHTGCASGSYGVYIEVMWGLHRVYTQNWANWTYLTLTRPRIRGLLKLCSLLRGAMPYGHCSVGHAEAHSLFSWAKELVAIYLTPVDVTPVPPRNQQESPSKP